MTLKIAQAHKDILQFFDVPRCVSLTDISKGTGWGRTCLYRRLPELIEAGYLKRTTYPHIWGKPHKYERTTRRTR